MFNYPGFFIAIEGLDGSGLTTQAERLVGFLREKEREVLHTKEHTLKADRTSDVASEIEAILNGQQEATAKELQDLFIKDRKWHLENVILPALKDGKDVVCDRYKFSTIAYGTANGVSKDYLIEEQEDFREPDLTILLKVSPETCIQRIEERGEDVTIFEKKNKLKKIWRVYEELSERFDMKIVNGEKSKSEVASKIQKVVEDELNI